ncbi:hypothetical protein [Paenibacillus helianthi]|uniref:hypothetical protein n=1 Tax=Paenibacillus helianthi TaxID=1349432 RepID=UPI000B0CF079|nr:hypothetical protein [Paenibacillus helianthi]
MKPQPGHKGIGEADPLVKARESVTRLFNVDSSWLQAARTIVADKQGDTREIIGTTIIKDSIYDKRGVVAVLVKLKDGSSYTAELRYPEKKLRCLIYTPASPASK